MPPRRLPRPWNREAAVAFRDSVRVGELTGPMSAMAIGATHANLLAIPAEAASEFEEFCTLNGRACPLLDRTAPGDPRPSRAAPDADLRTDVPRYRVYRQGRLVGEPESVASLWRDDLVGFLLGCSFTFEAALVRAGIPMRHHESGSNVPMYRTRLPCAPAGRFHGNMVVSMRPVRRDRLDAVGEICSAFPAAHGAPIAVGHDPALGIDDLAAPDFGDAIEVRPGEVPVFWACGVTGEVVAANAALDLVITHAPGHTFVTDWPAENGARAVMEHETVPHR